MHTLHVSGRRWFQRTHGNTYNTVAIYIDGEHAVKLGESYGYGDHYLQRAVEWLKDNGKLPGFDREHLRMYCERTGVKYTYECADVARERDL